MSFSHRVKTLRTARTIFRLIDFLFLGIFGGCTVGPDYHPPQQAMPQRWQAPATTEASIPVQGAGEVEQWWKTFNDPTLNSLIGRAVVSNLDLRAATERILEARASVGVATARLFPVANLSGAYTRSGAKGVAAQNLWREGLDAAWELDVFGGVRRSVEQADATLAATVEDRRDVLVTLLGEVATDYILLRGQQQEIVIARENLEAQIRNSKLTREKKRLGTGTELDIVQSDALVASTNATIERFLATEQQIIHALGVLLGSEPTALEMDLQPHAMIPDPPPIVEVGVPSDLLRRRPDIRRAERQLAAATAGIGVATADLFPRFSITGDVGLQGSQFKALGNINSNFWAFGPSVTWPIFDAGRIRSNIDIQNAVTAQALTLYRRTVLSALQEVQDDLVAFAQEQRRRAALADAVTLNQRAVVLATGRYKQGLTDFLAVLDAERTLFASQDALVQSNRSVGTDAVALFKALGGGWDTPETAPTTQPFVSN